MAKRIVNEPLTIDEKLIAEQPLIEVRRYTYNDITIDVEVNHMTGKASLVEMQQQGTSYSIKPWKFGSRTVAYLATWRVMFALMEYVTRQAMHKIVTEDRSGLRTKDLSDATE